MRSRQRTPSFRDRLRLLTAVSILGGTLIILRLFELQVLRHQTFSARAEEQHAVAAELKPKRGEILVRDRFSGNQLFPLATNRTYHLLYAVPREVEDPLAVARALDPLIELDEATILARLSKPGDIFEPLSHGLTDEDQAAIETLKLPGIAFQDEALRYYPEGRVGSHLLGFVGYDGAVRKGQYGLEGRFEDLLAGQPGSVRSARDASGRPIATADRLLTRPQDGADLILTIDRTIEYEACSKLDAWVTEHGASGGSLIILNPASGAVLALCGTPNFDPNAYEQAPDLRHFANPAIFATYEPGSVFKPFTLAAALDLGRITPETTYTDTGEVRFGRFTIKNSDGKTHGLQTMTQVLVESLNTGAIFAVQQVGSQPFADYLKAFGFGAKTGVELPSEQTGNLSSLKQNKDIYAATASYGQGITITPLQLAAAFGAIANQGKLLKPYLVEEIIHPDGRHEKTEPTIVRQVLSPRTAATLGAMLVKVVREGHGKRAGVPGYFVAGKTGTAQIPSEDERGYEPNITIGTFAGYAPVNDPRFVMVVRVDRPKDVQFAESSAAPLFGQLAEFLLHYLEVPPQEPPDR